MDVSITLTVNGEKKTATTDPSRTLLEVLREDLGMTGTKYGCGEGQCGACTVLVEGERALACIVPIASVEGKSVDTIEGLGDGDALDSVQRAFLEEDASQCGYCTSGMIMTTVALLKENPRPTDKEIVKGLNDNLCRCCGYPKIIQAVRLAAQLRSEVKAS